MSIVVIGTVFVDIKGFPDDLYSPTGRNAGRIEFVHGGVGRNVAEDIANVGLRPSFVSLVDETGNAEEVVKRLRERGVRTDFIFPARDGMGMWLAVFDNNGDLAGSISKRPNMKPIVKILEEREEEIFQEADSIILEIDLDDEAAAKALECAKRCGKKLFVLVSNILIAAQSRELLKSVECFICNYEEACLFFVSDFSGLEKEALAEELLCRIRKAQIPSMIVTLGGDGAVYASLDGDCGYYPAEKVEVRDTTGAGDAFCAGVAIGRTYGKTLREAVAIGTRLAASVIMSTESTCPKFLPEEFDLDVAPAAGGES